MAGQMLSQGHLWFLGDLSLLHPKNSSGNSTKGGYLILKAHMSIDHVKQIF